MCGGPFDGPAYVVNASRWRGRRRWGTRELICEPCYKRGRIDPETNVVPVDAEPGERSRHHLLAEGRLERSLDADVAGRQQGVTRR